MNELYKQIHYWTRHRAFGKFTTKSAKNHMEIGLLWSKIEIFKMTDARAASPSNRNGTEKTLPGS